MSSYLRTQDIENASFSQRTRILAAEKLGIGNPFTRIAVWAELGDIQNGVQQGELEAPRRLAALACKLMDTQSQQKRYALLAEPLPVDLDKPDKDRRVWFDAVAGLTELPILRGVVSTAKENLPSNKDHWERAVDLGAGTGRLGSMLAGYETAFPLAEQVTLVDRVPALLSRAALRYESDLLYSGGEVAHLPFANQTFDLAVSGGLIYSIDPEEQATYFSEISRILTSDGIYIDGDYSSALPCNPETNEGRFLLSCLIRAHVSGDFKGDPLYGIDQEEYFTKFDLKLSRHRYVDPLSGNRVNLRVLKKENHK